MRRLFFRTLPWCAALVLLGSTVQADPVLVTGGSFEATSPFFGNLFTFLGEGLNVQFPGDPLGAVGLRLCSPCSTGGTLNFNANVTAEGNGPALIDGIAYPLAFFSGEEVFHGPTLSADVLSPTALTVTVPFEFAGTLSGFPTAALDNVGGTPLFAVHLVGSGIATATYSLNPFFDHPVFEFKSATYAFEPTPEPVTGLLFLVGLATVGLRARMRSRPPGAAD